jgi:hypothetical protein
MLIVVFQTMYAADLVVCEPPCSGFIAGNCNSSGNLEEGNDAI